MTYASDQGTFESGVLKVDEIEKGDSTVSITITVGTQWKTYDVAQLSVIHCQQHILFPNVKDFVAQIGSKIKQLDYRAVSTDDEKDDDCPLGEHVAESLVDGITLDQNGVL